MAIRHILIMPDDEVNLSKRIIEGSVVDHGNVDTRKSFLHSRVAEGLARAGGEGDPKVGPASAVGATHLSECF